MPPPDDQLSPQPLLPSPYPGVLTSQGPSYDPAFIPATGGGGGVSQITFNAPLTGGTVNSGNPIGTVGLGNVPPGNLNSGVNANSTTFWRGDGTWQVPAGGGNISGAVSQNQLIIGGASSTQISSLGALGTATTVLHGNAGGAPSFAPVSLTTDVSGILPPANLGTGVNAAYFLRGDGTWQPVSGGAGNVNAGAALTLNAVVIGQGTTNVATLAAVGASNTVLHGNTGAAPSFSAVNLAMPGGDVTGILPVANGGTGAAIAATSGGIPYFSSTTVMGSSALLVQYGVVLGGGAGGSPTVTAAGATGQVLTGVTGAAPTWQTPSGVTTSTSLVNNQLVLGTGASTVAPLAAGTSGYFLQSSGAGAAPTWQPVSGSGTVVASNQFQIPYYGTAGSVASVQGNANLNTTAAGGLTLGAPVDGNLGASTLNTGAIVQVNANTTVTSANWAPLANTLIHFEGVDGTTPRLLGTGFGGQPIVVLRTAVGTGGAPTQAVATTTLGSYAFSGYASTGWGAGRANMSGVAGEAWTGTAQGAYLTFSTTQNTTTSVLERLRIVQGVLVDGAAGALPTGGTGGDMGVGTVNVATGYYVNGTSTGLIGDGCVSAAWLAGANPNGATIFVNNTGRQLLVQAITGVPEILAGAAATADVYSAASGTAIAGSTKISTSSLNANVNAGTTQSMLSAPVNLANGSRLLIQTSWGGTASVGSITVYLQ